MASSNAAAALAAAASYRFFFFFSRRRAHASSERVGCEYCFAKSASPDMSFWLDGDHHEKVAAASILIIYNKYSSWFTKQNSPALVCTDIVGSGR